MSKVYRSPGLTSLLMLAAVGLVPIGFSLSTSAPCLADPVAIQDPGGQDTPKSDGQVPGDDGTMPKRGSRTKSSSSKKGQSVFQEEPKKRTRRARVRRPRPRPAALTMVESSFHKMLRRFSWPIASIAIAETTSACAAESST